MYDLVTHLKRAAEFSARAFGPFTRKHGVVEHIRKELSEIESDPSDVREWIDVVILGFDGALRTGASPEQIADALFDKQVRNERRQWPDWRLAADGAPIEHRRDPDERKRKLREELRSTESRYRSLRGFMQTEAFRELEPEHRALLAQQCAATATLANILSARCVLLGEDVR